MIAIMTQNFAIVNFDQQKFIACQKDSDKIVITADENIILGYYNNLNDAVMVMKYLATAIGGAKDRHILINMPQADSVGEVVQNAEDN